MCAKLFTQTELLKYFSDLLFQNADTLEAKYSDASLQLSLKYNQTKVARERADSLRIRAARLYQGTYEKIERLRSNCSVTLLILKLSNIVGSSKNNIVSELIHFYI